MQQEEKKSYEAKKQEREFERESARKRARIDRTMKMLAWYGLAIILVLLAGYGIYLFGNANAPKGEDFSVVYDTLGRSHIPDGAPRPEYNSNPPSSGAHYAQTVRGGFYDVPLRDENVVHNLEHGDVWITYRPDIAEEVKNVLKTFAGQYVVVSARAENEHDISLVAWGRVDSFDLQESILPDESRISDFIRRYDNRGPEKVRNVQIGHGGR